MTTADFSLRRTVPRDLVASVVVFLVALPLCLGVALASGAPLLSGILAGIVGGIVVGLLSGSHTSVSGPAAGLTAIVATQIAALGSFEAFLTAVVLAGVLQIVLGAVRGGFIAAYFPSSVIKGLLAAIGLILVLKQIPHLFGHDADPLGEMAFVQPDAQNTFSELWQTLRNLHPGAGLIGFASLGLLIVWNRVAVLKNSPVPASLVVVVVGVIGSVLLRQLGADWVIGASHLVQVPVTDGAAGLGALLVHPDFSYLRDSAVYIAALTVALVASLETLLNLEAVDGLDPYKRHSNPNRELFAQGVGNVAAGLIGGLPVTSVIVRSSVNIQAGGRTRLATILHGFLLLGCVALLPTLLNRIPLSALAAILLMTGLKLASPQLFKDMWRSGRTQFIPFMVTVLAIVFTDLLVGIVIGLVNATFYILHSNMRRPLRRFQERHLGGDVLRIELANQVSFLNKAAIARTLDGVPAGSHVVLDASATDYIDSDVMELIHDFERTTAPARGVTVSLAGFKDRYEEVEDHIGFVDFTSRDVQARLTPAAVLEHLRQGNERFRSGHQLTRDLGRQMSQTAQAQYPLAAVLSCIDSRTPVELLFDLGLGDIFSVRIAGNVARSKVLGSLEYSCVVAGAKLVLVMGHTSCGAVNAAVDLVGVEGTIAAATGCDNLEPLIHAIQESVPAERLEGLATLGKEEKRVFADQVARLNVLHMLELIRSESPALDRLVRAGRIGIVGAMYDVTTGTIEFLPTGDDVPALADTPGEPGELVGAG